MRPRAASTPASATSRSPSRRSISMAALIAIFNVATSSLAIAIAASLVAFSASSRMRSSSTTISLPPSCASLRWASLTRILRALRALPEKPPSSCSFASPASSSPLMVMAHCTPSAPIASNWSLKDKPPSLSPRVTSMNDDTPSLPDSLSLANSCDHAPAYLDVIASKVLASMARAISSWNSPMSRPRRPLKSAMATPKSL